MIVQLQNCPLNYMVWLIGFMLSGFLPDSIEFVCAHAGTNPNAATPHHEHDKSEVFHADQKNIEEHLSDKVDVTNKTKMSEEELSFHYFHLHDRDNNTKLDGLEIMEAVRGAHEDENLTLPTMVEMEELIDSVLIDHDLNNDGYIDFGEFVKAQATEAQRMKDNPEHQQQEQQKQQQEQPQQQQQQKHHHQHHQQAQQQKQQGL